MATALAAAMQWEGLVPELDEAIGHARQQLEPKPAPEAEAEAEVGASPPDIPLVANSTEAVGSLKPAAEAGAGEERGDETGGFSYARLEEYTEGFTQLLGQGGFGSV